MVYPSTILRATHFVTYAESDTTTAEDVRYGLDMWATRREADDEKRQDARKIIEECVSSESDELKLEGLCLRTLPYLALSYMGFRLKRLKLTNNCFIHLPLALKDLRTLEELDLTNNQLEALADLPASLQTLLLADNKIKTLPPLLQHLTNLRVLDIARNAIRAIPKELALLPSLAQLTIVGNPIEDFPAEFATRPHLEIISGVLMPPAGAAAAVAACGGGASSAPVEHSTADSISPEASFESALTDWVTERSARVYEKRSQAAARIGACYKEKTIELNLQGLSLRTLPKVLFELDHIKVLKLRKNSLGILSPLIKKLHNLMALIISQNGLQALPEAIGLLDKLQILDVSFNSLRALPETFGSLSSLTCLQAGHNDMVVFPKVITSLTSLKILDLSANALFDLPDDIAKLTALEQLYLNHNEYSFVPNPLFLLSALKVFNMTNHVLSSTFHSQVLRALSARITYGLTQKAACGGAGSTAVCAIPETKGDSPSAPLSGSREAAGGAGAISVKTLTFAPELEVVREIPSVKKEDAKPASLDPAFIDSLVYLKDNRFKHFSRIAHLACQEILDNMLETGIVAGTVVKELTLSQILAALHVAWSDKITSLNEIDEELDDSSISPEELASVKAHFSDLFVPGKHEAYLEAISQLILVHIVEKESPL